ncbi:hypothetical protein Tco_0721315 [Tanacetum coccineum]
MTTLQFADTHNLVAFLAKPTKSEGFEQVVDFLNAHTIKYALTVNLTIYTSCIENFWATIKVKTVNWEQQLHALVDGKKIVVTEESVRRDLHLDDEEGTDCLHNATIFEELTRMGYEKLSQKLTYYKAFFYPQWKFLFHIILQCLSAKTTTLLCLSAKTTAWNEFSSIMASASLTFPSIFLKVFLDNQLEGMASHNRTYIAPSHTKKIFANKRRQGKDFSGRVTPLFPTIVDQAQEEIGGQRERTLRVLDLENTKTAQAQEITSLKLRVKKLEKKGRSRTHKLRRLYKGRKIDDIDKDAEITLVNKTQARYGDEDMFEVNDLDGGKVVVESEVTNKASKKRNIVEEAVAVTDVVTIPVSAATITNVELTLA